MARFADLGISADAIPRSLFGESCLVRRVPLPWIECGMVDHFAPTMVTRHRPHPQLIRFSTDTRMFKHNHALITISLAAAICLPLSCGCQRPAVSPNHQFSLRLADLQPAQGMSLETMRTSGEEIYVFSSDIVVGSEFTSIHRTYDEKGRPAMSFQVTKEAAVKLSKTTSDNVGTFIALVIDGVPESAVPIVSPFSDTFQITGDFTDADIDQLYSAVTGYDPR